MSLTLPPTFSAGIVECKAELRSLMHDYSLYLGRYRAASDELRITKKEFNIKRKIVDSSRVAAVRCVESLPAGSERDALELQVAQLAGQLHARDVAHEEEEGLELPTNGAAKRAVDEHFNL